VRFAPAHLGLIDQSQAFDAILRSVRAQRFERVQFGVVVRDDQFAASPVRNIVCGAELVQHSRAIDAVPRLERAGRIVDARVYHLTVVRARRHSGTRLFLQHANAVALPRNGQRRRQSHHSGSDNRGIDLFHHT